MRAARPTFLTATPEFSAALRREIGADRVVYMVAGLYALAGCASLAVAGTFSVDAFLGYLGVYATLLSGPIWVTIAVAAIAAAILHEPRAPLRRLASWCTVDNAARVLAGLPLATAAMLFFGTYTTMKSAVANTGFHADRLLADADRFLHFGTDPAVALHAALDPAVVLPYIDTVYSAVWGLWFYGFMLWMAFGPDQRRLRVRYFVTLFGAWGLLGTVTAAIGSSAGPCYYGMVTGDTLRFAGLTDALRHAVPGGTSAAALQDYLWAAYASGSVRLGSGISAFPSIHVALVAVNALFAYERDRRLGVLAFALVPAMMFGSVYLGWHYAVDGYASLIAVPFVHMVVRRWMERREVPPEMSTRFPSVHPFPIADRVPT
jgi:hypothetical protein